MSKTEIYEKEPQEETWVMRREGRGLVAPQRSQSCKCGRCRLYRWYPPLLVVSTIMTGVFCFLYLTKPVFLEAPAMKVHDGGHKIPAGYMITGTEVDPEPASPDLDLPRELDPGRLSFPAESQEVDPVVAALSQPEPLDLLDVPAVVPPAAPERNDLVSRAEESAMAPFVVERPAPMPVRVNVGRNGLSSEPVGAGGFQPLRIAPPNKPLFQSLTKADLARLEARRRARNAPAVEEPTQDAGDPLDPDPDPDLGSQDDALAIEEVREAPDALETAVIVSDDPEAETDDEPVMRASFIGEFYPDKDEEVTEDEILHKTAMR